jgi:hypothetical protein
LKLDTEVTLGEKNQTTKQKRTRGSQEESWWRLRVYQEGEGSLGDDHCSKRNVFATVPPLLLIYTDFALFSH